MVARDAHGGMGGELSERRRAAGRRRPAKVVATGGTSAGLDDPRLDTLVLAMPIAWKGTMTSTPDGYTATTTPSTRSGSDYVDHEVPVLRRMYAKRQRAYTGLGYQAG